jgi:ribulose-phosphate 3-epimerase
MDGHFVPNITVGPLIVEAVRRITDLPLDVHLMIENPDAYIDDFSKAGSTLLTVHPEVCYHLQRTLQSIKDKGMSPAVALNPATPLSVLDHIIDDIDMVLVMTVNPGFGGQKFIPSMLPKIKALRKLFDDSDSTVSIEVDGGVILDNIEQVSQAGADIFVSGSGIFKTPDYHKTISAMKKLLS